VGNRSYGLHSSITNIIITIIIIIISSSSSSIIIIIIIISRRSRRSSRSGFRSVGGFQRGSHARSKVVGAGVYEGGKALRVGFGAAAQRILPRRHTQPVFRIPRRPTAATAYEGLQHASEVAPQRAAAQRLSFRERPPVRYPLGHQRSGGGCGQRTTCRPRGRPRSFPGSVSRGT
jgi:hypothetical protein